MAQPASTAQRDIDGLAAGVKAADGLIPNAILADSRRAAGVGAPR